MSLKIVLSYRLTEKWMIKSDFHIQYNLYWEKIIHVGILSHCFEKSNDMFTLIKMTMIPHTSNLSGFLSAFVQIWRMWRQQEDLPPGNIWSGWKYKLLFLSTTLLTVSLDAQLSYIIEKVSYSEKLIISFMN